MKQKKLLEIGLIKEKREIKFEQAWTKDLTDMIERGMITVTIDKDGQETFKLTEKGFEEAHKMQDPDTGEPLVTKEHEERWKNRKGEDMTATKDKIESNNRTWRDDHDKED